MEVSIANWSKWTGFSLYFRRSFWTSVSLRFKAKKVRPVSWAQQSKNSTHTSQVHTNKFLQPAPQKNQHTLALIKHNNCLMFRSLVQLTCFSCGAPLLARFNRPCRFCRCKDPLWWRAHCYGGYGARGAPRLPSPACPAGVERTRQAKM